MDNPCASDDKILLKIINKTVWNDKNETTQTKEYIIYLSPQDFEEYKKKMNDIKTIDTECTIDTNKLKNEIKRINLKNRRTIMQYKKRVYLLSQEIEKCREILDMNVIHLTYYIGLNETVNTTIMYKKELMMKINQEKFKMCIHKLKLYLPDHLIYQIGNYL